MRARVLAAAAGNPLALVELARSLPPETGIHEQLSFPALPLTAPGVPRHGAHGAAA